MTTETRRFIGFWICAGVRVRIVTGSAGQRIFTLQEALAFHQAKGLKAIGFVARHRRGLYHLLGDVTLAAKVVDARGGPVCHRFDSGIAILAGAHRSDVCAAGAMTRFTTDSKKSLFGSQSGKQRIGGKRNGMTKHTTARSFPVAHLPRLGDR